MIREVYVKGLTGQNVYVSAFHADLFPHLDQLITVHTALFSSLLRQHCAREDKIIENLGQCLLGTLTSETINLLIECYGQLMFVQSSLNDRLTNLRKDMFIAEALAAENDFCRWTVSPEATRVDQRLKTTKLNSPTMASEVDIKLASGVDEST
ncbi:unnamed protein product [Dibothriocephalus latus]|uniref:Uncharacterized protein n=1 Tax=Dibothriocephalus latus TaxID=60516 RepID=A0A3P6UIU4_DIBLA|nr:unnamed protein product [Dibothriocephalus latus]